MNRDSARSVPIFGRGFFSSEDIFSRIGDGRLGGKAAGLVGIAERLAARFAERPVPGAEVSIPRMTVVTTDGFESFMAQDDLWEIALSGMPDARIAHAFQKGDLPAELLGDLRALIEEARRPLAIRSSSLLEDALAHPFAGIYETKMVPNHQSDDAVRFQGLMEAIKLVYASTFFEAARSYRKAIGADDREERMAVVIQEIVGAPHGTRFYPDVSAVARSFNYYPTGAARAEDGVAHLALGLGKTIVDGGVCWSYSPRFPSSPPPFASARRMLEETQTRFWAVNMGEAPPYDPIAGTEHLVHLELPDAEYDGTLRHVASTYVPSSDRLSPGTGRDGPRVLDFAPVLQLRQWPLNEVIQELLTMCASGLDTPVEIELAAAFDAREERARVGLVQVRAMSAPGEHTPVEDDELIGQDVLLSSRKVMGNGESVDIRDVVYTKPDVFELRHTSAVAAEVGALNRALTEERRPYLLIGFGRWGSVDPWLGIPVTWGQVSAARVIVEATLPGSGIEPSQGSHFFHNMSSLGVRYFSVGPGAPVDVRWSWLAQQPSAAEATYLRHVRLDTPLHVRVDGKNGCGFVRVGRPGGERT